MKKLIILQSCKKVFSWCLTPVFIILFLQCISVNFCALWGHAATNSTGMTVPSLQANAFDSILFNYGTISPGQNFVSSGNSPRLHGFSGMYGDSNGGTQSFTFFNYGNILISQSNTASRGMSAFAQNGSHALYNAGTIHVATSLGNETYAFGMQARSYDNNTHNLVNASTIKVTSSADNSPAYGMEAFSYDGSHRLINTNTIFVSTSGNNSSAFGMNAYTDGGNGNHYMLNTGSITVSTTGDSSQAFGMDPSVGNNGSYTVINNGTIFASVAGDANSYAAAMNAYTKVDGSHTFTNNGTLIARADGELARSYGIQIFSENSGNHTVVNTAYISSIASGDRSRGYGIRASSLNSGNHFLRNTGFIYAENTSPTGLSSPAHGMVADIAVGGGNHTLYNEGTIIAVARGANIRAFGMRAASNTIGNHFLENGGIISSTAYGDQSEAFGLAANAANGNHVLRNDGFIRVHSADTDGGAYGLYVTGVGSHVLSNRGLILASAPKGSAYEAYGEAGYSVDTWATTLRTWTDNDAVLGVAAGQSIRLGNGTEGAHLILRPGTKAQGFALGTSYDVARMLSVGGVQQTSLNQITALGSVASVSAEVDFLQAKLDNTDPTKPLVRLEGNVTEKTTSGSMTQQQNLAIAQRQFSNISQNLRKMLLQNYLKNIVTDTSQGLAAGSEHISAHAWQTFLNPYAAGINNTHFGYNGSTIGVSGGATYAITEKFSLGGHVDLSTSNLSASIFDTHTKSTSFAVGAHASYAIIPQWYLRGQLSASFTQSTHSYTLPLASGSLYDDTSSYGETLYASLATGYTWRLSSQHSLTPEIGISYINNHGANHAIYWEGGYTTNDLYDLQYDDSYYSALYATCTVDWRSEWAFEDGGSIALLAGVGLRQRLSTQEMDTTVRVLDTDFTTSSSEAQSTWLVDAGFAYTKDNLSVRLNYVGNYDTQQTIHGGNLILTFAF